MSDRYSLLPGGSVRRRRVGPGAAACVGTGAVGVSRARARRARARSPWWTLFAMCFALFMIMLDATIVNVALPSIQRALHTTPETLQWTIDAYVLTYAALILFGGKLGDRFGRRRMFLAGLAVFTLASAACALASTDTELVVFRAV